MPQHFLCALTLTATLMTTLTTKMTHEPHDHDRDGSKLTLPRFDHKDEMGCGFLCAQQPQGGSSRADTVHCHDGEPDERAGATCFSSAGSTCRSNCGPCTTQWHYQQP